MLSNVKWLSLGGAHDREGDLSYAKSFIDSHLKTLIYMWHARDTHVTRAC